LPKGEIKNSAKAERKTKGVRLSMHLCRQSRSWFDMLTTNGTYFFKKETEKVTCSIVATQL